VILEDERFRSWLEQKVGITLQQDARFIGRIVDGKVAWVVGFSRYVTYKDGADIELTVAVEKGITRESLRIVFWYVFETARCNRCTVRTSASNTKAQKLAKQLGFVHEGTLRKGLGDEDMMIYGLLRNEYGQYK